MSETSDVSHYYIYILHSLGNFEATKNRTPLRLIHYEYFINKDDALARGKFLKSGYGRRQFAGILKITIENISK